MEAKINLTILQTISHINFIHNHKQNKSLTASKAKKCVDISKRHLPQISKLLARRMSFSHAIWFSHDIIIYSRPPQGDSADCNMLFLAPRPFPSFPLSAAATHCCRYENVRRSRPRGLGLEMAAAQEKHRT